PPGPQRIARRARRAGHRIPQQPRQWRRPGRIAGRQMSDKAHDVLCIIPARGGSKGLPGKNIKPLAGKPLIAYSIEAAAKSGVCDDIVVSTDAEDIAQAARAAGAWVPFLRPPELSTDSALTEPVLTHAIETIEREHGWRYSIVVFLQPTD